MDSIQATRDRSVDFAPEARRRERARQEVREREDRRTRDSGDRVEISREAAQRLEQDRSEDREREESR